MDGSMTVKRTRMDTLLLNADVLAKWKLPPFQRPLRVNNKVREIAEDLRTNGGVVPGTITLGIIDIGPEQGTYLLDGQHRIEAFRMSAVKEGFADVRIVEHESLADMGKEFVQVNSSIVRMRPDDVLRGLENSLECLRAIRATCPFVGYDNIRRSEHHPVVSMGTLLRVWAGSLPETPTSTTSSATIVAQDMTNESALQLIDFLHVAIEAWGRGPDTQRLWSSLNLCLTMWLWRRTVRATGPAGQKRAVRLTPSQFKKCLMSLAANQDYNDWLMGRQLSERDRSPAMNRIKLIFATRLREEGESNTRMPSAPWISN